MKFEIYRDKAGEWRWRIRASNERILADSGEGYDNEGDCVDAIALIRVNAKSAPLVFVSPTGAEESL